MSVSAFESCEDLIYVKEFHKCAQQILYPACFSFLINLFIYLFIFGCVGSSLLRAGFL